MKISDSGMQAEHPLCPFPPFEAKLLPLLTSCRTVGLFDQSVATCRGTHLLVADVNQDLALPDGCPITPEPIGVNDLWDIEFTQESDQKVFAASVSR